MALPTVACDIRGCREIVIEAATGLLTPVRDAAALSAAVRELLQDGDRRRRMGSAGRQRVLERYTESGAAQRVMDVYEAFTVAPGG